MCYLSQCQCTRNAHTYYVPMYVYSVAVSKAWISHITPNQAVILLWSTVQCSAWRANKNSKSQFLRSDMNNIDKLLYSLWLYKTTTTPPLNKQTNMTLQEFPYFFFIIIEAMKRQYQLVYSNIYPNKKVTKNDKVLTGELGTSSLSNMICFMQ